MKLTVDFESWPLVEPFETSQERLHAIDMVMVTLTDAAGHCGRAEAIGVSDLGETPQDVLNDLRAFAPRIAARFDRQALAGMLGPGGARNALDCALWDLETKRSGRRIWDLTDSGAPQALVTAFTIGLGAPGQIAARAKRAASLPLIKIKLDAERHLDVVRLVRSLAPRSRLIVDANQAWSRPQLEALLPDLHRLGVELVEQPVPRGEDEALRGLRSPIPLSADESATDRSSLAALGGLYQAINIKLDKTGGLTEALAMAEAAQAMGLDLMVGCMCGTSLGMAAAWPLAMRCRWVDLDGPLLLARDRDACLVIEDGLMQPPSRELWG
jgi:L-Ala-D/L-Glu epimerase